jgi:hypothetical protein
VFDLRIQLVKQGRIGRRVAETSRMTVGVKSYASFGSCGDEPLILLRIAGLDQAAVKRYGKGKSPARFTPDGRKITSESPENKKEPEIPIEGMYFE